MSYCKISSSILSSTVWAESLQVRIVWITMLVQCNRFGEVCSSVPGLAQAAGVSIPECEEALRVFMSPDKYSRTKDNEGRRIAEIDGGWAILNYEKYRDKDSLADVKRKNAERQKRFRENHETNSNVTKLKSNVTMPESSVTITENNAPVTHQPYIADTDTDTDTDTEADTEADVSLRVHNETNTTPASPEIPGVPGFHGGLNTDTKTSANAAPVDPKPKTVPKAKKQPTGPHAELIRYWVEKWEERHKPEKYPFRTIDAVKIQELLKACGNDPPKARGVVDRFLATDETFYRGHAVAQLMCASILPRFLVGSRPVRHNNAGVAVRQDN